MQAYPAFPSAAPPAPANKKKKNWWLALSIGIGLVILVLGIIYLRTRPAKDVEELLSDLPAWFDHAHRICPATKATSIEGIGMLVPPPVEPSTQFKPPWLEQHFTHYVADDVFVWATPENRYPTDGKVFGGTKVISSGKQVNQFSLVCTITKDGRAINFFMETRFLSQRANGPPEIRDDD